MVPVKIECDCGQNYAFDVEPVNGRMPAAVVCPACGADGTTAANDYISQQLAPTATATAIASAQMAAGPSPVRLVRAQVQAQPTAMLQSAADDPARAKLVREARAKMIGGDSTEQVAAFLTIKGFDPAEAIELARGFYQERASIVRTNGMKKAIVGLVLILVPFIAYFVFKAAGHFMIKRFFWAYGVGIIGGYMFVSGIIMIVAPKSEKGTVVKE
jgi:hypothetical protein